MLQILRKLKHENIIEMLDSFETPQEFCVVTEFAQVISFSHFLFSILYFRMKFIPFVSMQKKECFSNVPLHKICLVILIMI